MKLRGQVHRRKARIRKAAFFSFVGSLVLTGFITPPIVQAPQGYKPDQSMEENRPSNPEKPGVQLSQEKKPKKHETEATGQPQPSGYALKENEPQTIQPVHTTTDTQQNWSHLRSRESASKEKESAVTSVPADEDRPDVNEPETRPDDQQPQEPENGEERPPEDETDDPSTPEEPAKPGEGEEPAEPGDGTDEQPKDGDESDGDDRDERTPTCNNTLKDWLIPTKESDLAS